MAQWVKEHAAILATWVPSLEHRRIELTFSSYLGVGWGGILHTYVHVDTSFFWGDFSLMTHSTPCTSPEYSKPFCSSIFLVFYLMNLFILVSAQSPPPHTCIPLSATWGYLLLLLIFCQHIVTVALMIQPINFKMGHLNFLITQTNIECFQMKAPHLKVYTNGKIMLQLSLVSEPSLA